VIAFFPFISETAKRLTDELVVIASSDQIYHFSGDLSELFTKVFSRDFDDNPSSFLITVVLGTDIKSLKGFKPKNDRKHAGTDLETCF
jgi:hypothetical protein